MGVRKTLKRGLFGAFNFKKMIGFDRLKEQASSVKNIYDNAYKEEDSDFKPKSFADCLRHYGVSEEQLEIRMRNALWTVYFCLGLSALTLGYGIYQFASHFVSGGLLCLILTFILWTMAFKEHFNLFQMQQRRLGCTVKEWFYSLFKKKS